MSPARMRSIIMKRTDPTIPAHEASSLVGVDSFHHLALGESTQWVLIRGDNADNPIVLVLTGGLGGSDIAGARRLIGDVEGHCTVVTWDQRGSGKSLRAGYPPSTMTVRQLTSDALELVAHLRHRFGQRKIFLVGRSVGTVVAIRMAQERPEWFHAYVSIDQIVNPVERDRAAWDRALTVADRAGKSRMVSRLRRAGSPPYTGRWNALRYIVLARAAHRFLGEDLGLPRFTPRLPARAPGLGLLDPARRGLGLIRTLRLIYPRLQKLDLVTQSARLEIPVYLVTGTDKKTATGVLVERYHAALDCPYKELVRLDTVEEFDSWLIETVLPRVARVR